jgi:endonuclease YncB( thermonuclease family)
MNYPGFRRFVSFALVATAITAYSVSAQVKNAGEVLEVIDGRSAVVAVPTGKITIELQFIEVPESEQQLHAVVKDHLKKLILGKTVEIHTYGFSRGKARGVLYADGVDVGGQMVRDGAAWHMPRVTAGQSPADHDLYARYEALAKQEKRGVWSIAGLVPAWQFRADKAAMAKASSPRVSPGAAPVAAEKTKKIGPWSDENPWLKNPGGLVHGYNAASRTGYLSTSLLGVREDPKDTAATVGIDIAYRYTELGEKGRKGVFVVTVMSSPNDARFLKSNVLTIEVDGKNHVIGKATRDTTKARFGELEKLTYEVDKPTIEKMTNGARVVVKVGEYAIRPTTGLQMLLLNMLQAAA